MTDKREVPEFVQFILGLAAVAVALSVVIMVSVAAWSAAQYVEHHYPDPPAVSYQNLDRRLHSLEVAQAEWISEKCR